MVAEANKEKKLRTRSDQVVSVQNMQAKPPCYLPLSPQISPRDSPNLLSVKSAQVLRLYGGMNHVYTLNAQAQRLEILLMSVHKLCVKFI